MLVISAFVSSSSAGSAVVSALAPIPEQPDLHPLPKRGVFERFLNRVPERSQRAVVLATLLFGSVGSYCLINYGVISRVQVVGRSMEPNLHSGDLHLMHRWESRLHPPGRFEVVAIRDPLDEMLCVKRVVGLPGETVELVHGAVWIDGRPLEESYLAPEIRTLPYVNHPVRFHLAADQFLVLGDNRMVSVDGRVYGAIPRDRILGVIRN